MQRFAVAGLCATTFVTASARAADDPKASPSEPTREEIEAWLESRSLPPDIAAEDVPEAPPPPPRQAGVVLEGSMGALGHAGDMRFVSPMAPLFQLRMGWEPARWILLAVTGDVALGRTTFAQPPPEPRGYTLWGLGAGVRATWDAWSILGLFAQIEVGAARVGEDVLATYGFQDADAFGPYFGAMGGFKWYQVSPHYALVGQGGIRLYQQTFDRNLSGQTPLAWIGTLGLAYTFF